MGEMLGAKRSLLGMKLTDSICVSTWRPSPRTDVRGLKQPGSVRPVPIMYRFLPTLLLIATCLASQMPCCAQELSPYYLNVGSPTLTEVFVDPERGSDARSGTTRASALRTVSEAWNRIPSSQALSRGFRINLLPGVYGDDAGETPSYWELKRGTQVAPIILRAVDGQGTVTFTTDINMANVSYFYLINVTIIRGGDTFHCERCDHILLRGNSLIGAPYGRSNGSVAHETVKFNQSQYVYIENNLIRGAEDNAIDWVAVQYGHIVANSISDSQGWCSYVKGGSAYIRIEGNEFFDCFEGGVTAGQGTGLEYMTGPWLRYEAYDVKILNNIIHDVSGAALGVNGGYNVLLAHNTAYRIGSRSHLVEVVFGLRSCDENSVACSSRVTAGAWGPSSVGEGTEQPIGNKGVKILNNILYNPAGFSAGDQHFAIYAPREPTAGGIPSPQRTDIDLEIKGNLIWSGGGSQPLGIEGGGQGCAPSNTMCNENQLRADNVVNRIEPDMRAPAEGDFRPMPGGAILGLLPAALSPFAPRGENETTPEGELANYFARDRTGTQVSPPVVGAYSSSSSRLLPPANPESSFPQIPRAPAIASLTARYSKVGSRYRVSISFVVMEANPVSSVTARMSTGKRVRLKRNGLQYSAVVVLRSKARLSVTVSVRDKNGLVARKTTSVRAKRSPH